MSETEQLIRQFLRGDPEGPITRRKAATNYEEDLLGGPATWESTPAIQTTRAKVADTRRLREG